MNEIVVFGTGCFWCSEAAFRKVTGVVQVTPGYAGGQSENPNYESVSTGETGHAEVIKIEFDPKKISFDNLLEMFWQIHDPTSLNKQGNDVGTQYRSILLFTTDKQKETIDTSIRTLKEFNNKPIVTEVKKLERFYPAEEYHNDYYSKNMHQPYCSLVIAPKIKKFEQEFKRFIKN